MFTAMILSILTFPEPLLMEVCTKLFREKPLACMCMVARLELHEKPLEEIPAAELRRMRALCRDETI